MVGWSKETTKAFHEGYHGSYAGDLVADEVIRLSNGYVGDRILDVGAGSGALLKKLPQAIGIDLVSKHARMLQGDVSHMPFVNNTFDTVFLTEVLEHLDDTTMEACLNEIPRILIRGGDVDLLRSR